MATKAAYTCTKCKEPFKNRFALTAHLRFCKKGLRPPGKGGKIECPECKQKFPGQGLGSHRKSKHGVAGTSRWAVKARKAKQAHVNNKAAMGASQTATGTSGSTATLAEIKLPATNGYQHMVTKLTNDAAAHRAQAAAHLKKAERLDRLVLDLKGVS
jgi:Na+-transporting NADH:ubiquinone oxidoreductase subunit NqrC